MIIDFHTHTFPDKIAARAVASLQEKSHTTPFSDGTLSGLLENQDSAGIGMSVLLPVATNPSQPAHINASAAKTEAVSDGRAISFGAIHPDCGDYEAILKQAAALGLRGIKLHPVYQQTDIDDIRYLRILECAASLGLLVVCHAGEDIGFLGAAESLPTKIRRAVRSVGSVTLVAAHMGGWNRWEEAAEQLSDLPNVFVDTAFSTGRIPALPGDDYPLAHVPLLDPDGFLDMLDAFGSERVLFGTDSPWGDPRADIAFIEALPVSEETKERIFSGNALRLLGREP